MNDFYETVNVLASSARAQRLSGNHHHGTSSEFPLVGYCFDNAYVASYVFTEHGFSTHCIEGTTERVADSLFSEGLNPRECECVTQLAGNVHYWLHVTRGDNTAVVDIASDSYETLGECLVTPTLPDDYIELPDSQEEGRKTMKMVKEENVRCTFCGDHKYNTGGCPQCKDLSV